MALGQGVYGESSLGPARSCSSKFDDKRVLWLMINVILLQKLWELLRGM